MPTAAPPPVPDSDSHSDSDEFPIGATAVDVAWLGDDENVWFVTAQGVIGYFEPRSPWGNVVLTPGPGITGTANSLVAWPGHGAWTFLAAENGPAFVKCADGQYQVYPLNSPTDCRALALGKNRDGRTRIVAPLTWGQLAFVESGGSISTSTFHDNDLYGIAIAPRQQGRYWLTSPKGKALLDYDVSTGVFGSPIGLGFEPRDVTVTPAGDVVWIATTDKVVLKYAVRSGTFTRVETPFPANRMLATADGTLWFVSTAGDAVGYVLPDKNRASAIPTGQGSRPTGLTVSGDSRLWVALSGRQGLRRVSRHRLAVVSGDGQKTSVGKPFGKPFEVKATLLDGTPIGGQKIEFSVAEGSGVFENGEHTETRYTGTGSDRLGVATSSRLTPLKEGPCPVTARWTETDAVASFTRLNVTPQPGTADRVRYVSGAGQTVPAGKSFEHPMKVIAEDAQGNPVEGAEITFKVRGERMATFPGGTDTARVTSGSDGTAESPILTAGDGPGGFAVQVWADESFMSLLLQQNIH
ncbi:hypothetical protein [Streptomyces morookaense]|uniref:Big-1 domain-containing protein n=1 Tax=Streptomyces morookaense TaxID=1970 RepID=A0A7Y7B0K6_STRMO|nr:hypothetical protein [Streptomyces morookaense]NVK76421.1 hypothetical protein [Streptomyces morookaense]GHF06940.1 hypothetical protein GCM10010359_05040 [Streptomyces morookaense]